MEKVKYIILPSSDFCPQLSLKIIGTVALGEIDSGRGDMCVLE